MLEKPLNFAIYYAGDAYSTAQKIMGRQSAGKTFIKGLAKHYKEVSIHALGTHKPSAQNLVNQLRGDGHQGQVVWSTLPSMKSAEQVGTLYYPAPPLAELAHARAQYNTNAFSLMGVTHTLSSQNAIEQISNMILHPFQPWDALICTSSAAQSTVNQLFNESREYYYETLGANKFVDIKLPLIPLGVETSEFNSSDDEKNKSRKKFEIDIDSIVFLFAGRLTFHAKANPAPMYQALQKASKQSKIVCIEAGIFQNSNIEKAYRIAQKQLAPNVKFIWVDGNNELNFKEVWKSADVFISLSDNIQETFGITPIEAMASGLPVIVSDWNGYKDSIDHNIDGFKIKTYIPNKEYGDEIGLRYLLGNINYDYFIGMSSLSTVIDTDELSLYIEKLATNPYLIKRMGEKALIKARLKYDNKIILRQYEQLSDELTEIRKNSRHSLNYKDKIKIINPYHRFKNYATDIVDINRKIKYNKNLSNELINILMQLEITNYDFNHNINKKDNLIKIIKTLKERDEIYIYNLIDELSEKKEIIMHCVMWLIKFDVCKIL